MRNQFNQEAIRGGANYEDYREAMEARSRELRRQELNRALLGL